MTTGTERSSVLEAEREGAFRTCCGRAFQARAATTGNDRSSRVEQRVVVAVLLYSCFYTQPLKLQVYFELVREQLTQITVQSFIISTGLFYSNSNLSSSSASYS